MSTVFFQMGNRMINDEMASWKFCSLQLGSSWLFPVGSYHLPRWIANLDLNYDAPNSIDLY